VNEPPPSQPAVGTPVRVPAYIDRAYDAFVQSSMPLWIRFAHLHVGDREAGELIACEIAFQLHEDWEHVLARENPHRYAMNLLRSEIVRWCAENAVTDMMAAHAAFLSAMRAEQRRFAVLEESIGVFTAISRLPDRQYLAFVLRYVLGCEIEQVARLMGVSATTVATTTFHARQRLATELARPLDELEQEN
jgi:RNA polymerase sigma factor (sigma-70 family)